MEVILIAGNENQHEEQVKVASGAGMCLIARAHSSAHHSPDTETKKRDVRLKSDKRGRGPDLKHETACLHKAFVTKLIKMDTFEPPGTHSSLFSSPESRAAGSGMHPATNQQLLK